MRTAAMVIRRDDPSQTDCSPAIDAVKVSVIVPTRNRLAYLQEAIASVQGQTYDQWEIIVIDDASDDGTSAWLATLTDPRIRSFRLDHHRERCAARNHGLEHALGKSVMFLDDDDLLDPHALDLLSEELEQNPDAVAAVGGRVYFDDRGALNKFRLCRRRVKRVIWPDVLLGFVPGQGEALIQSAALVTAGMWNESVSAGEDHDLWLRLGSAGPVVISPGIVLNVRMHAAQTQFTGVRHVEQKFRAEFVRQLPSCDRALGESFHKAQRAATAGLIAFSRENYRRACAFFLDSIFKAPRLLMSPVSGPPLLSFLARSALGMVCGPRGMVFFRRMKAQIKSVSHFGTDPYKIRNRRLFKWRL